MMTDEAKDNHIVKEVAIKAAVSLIAGLTPVERKEIFVPLPNYAVDIARMFEKYLKEE